jgi:hypothetical protein
VRSPRGGNKVTVLPHDTSLLDVRAGAPEEKDIVEIDGLRLFSLPAALIASSPGFFEHNSTDARAVLAAIRDASDVLDPLLEGGHSTIAGRLAGAFRNIGRDRIADDILNAMRRSASGHEERFPQTRMNAGCGFRKETIAGMRRKGRDAPKPAVRLSWVERVKQTQLRPSCSRLVAQEAVIRVRLLVMLADRLTSARRAAPSPL